MAEEVYRTHCSRMDHGGCGLLVTIKDGRVLRVKGDPKSPISRGYICPKGLATTERLYHPDRLLYPMARQGKRAAGAWRRISWQEAMEILRSKILDVKTRWGARSILFGQGAPKGLEFFLLLRLANALGSPNVAGPQNICHMPREIAASLTCGFWPDVDYDHPPACIVLWGSNLDMTNEEGTICSRLGRALGRGARAIVVDPRPTKLAQRAHLWLRLRPGTDAALALGMMRAVLDDGLEDREFIRDWTIGFPELASRLDQYSLDVVEEVTWVPKQKIQEAARLYATHRPAAIQWGNALEHTVLSHQSCRSVLCLMAITGNLDVPGGNIRAGMAPCMPLRQFVLPELIPGRHSQTISAPLNIHPMIATIPPQLAVKALLDDEPYPIKALYLQGTNPLMSYPDALAVKKALERVPFIAVADLFLTPTAAMADLVLPVATHFEFDDIGHYGLPHGFLLARPKLVNPPGESWSDLKILNELGKALNLRDYFWEDEGEMLEDVLAPSGFDYWTFREQGILWGKRRYRAYLEHGFKTPSKKVELYSRALEKVGLDPLPSYSGPTAACGGESEDFPLILTSAKSPVFFHSGNRQLPSLRKISKEPVVEIAPETAEPLGIFEGDWVCIHTDHGSIRQRAHLTPGLDPRVVSATHGWWFPEDGYANLFGWKEANLNVLTSGNPPYNPLVASVNLRCIPCSLEKVARMS
jgi:anaerobic selenocysteine-containing dehydrogenase